MDCTHRSDLPYTDDGIGDEDKQNDKWLDEGCDGLLTFLKPSQHLQRKRHRVRDQEEHVRVFQTPQRCFSVYVGDFIGLNNW